MRHLIQPLTLEKHEIILQARRIERESEERKLLTLKARLLAQKQEHKKPVGRAA